MGAVLQRVTTAYLENEDRLRLTGKLADGDIVVLWLTQRLLSRLVPHLTTWLARQAGPFASTVTPYRVQKLAKLSIDALAMPFWDGGSRQIAIATSCFVTFG